MEFQTIKKDNRKKWLIGIGIIVVIVTTIMFVGTRAKYKTTQSIDLVDGVINYHPTDLTIVGIYLKDDNNYTETNTVPTSGYKLNTSKTYCNVKGIKDSSIPVESKDGKVYIGVSSKNTECYLYFDKEPTAGEIILAGKTIDTSRANGITGTLTTNTTGKIYKAQDDDGDTYFFAGAVDNNWIQFGDFYWRIIRINGDGTIRMIYSGVANGNVSNSNKTGTTTQINGTTYKFNTNYDDNAYVGYMYGATGQSGNNGYENTHKNTNSSTVKKQIDSWYNTNLNKTGVKEHIDTNAGFCGDRTIDKTAQVNNLGDGYGTQKTGYGPYGRLLLNGNPRSTIKPTFKCSQNNDLYTVSGANKGNEALTHPIGLITSDEVAYAGGVFSTINSSYYLYTNQHYWTISPSMAISAALLIVNSKGNIDANYAGGAIAVRPVINLRADTKLTGSGTETNPYKVV